MKKRVLAQVSPEEVRNWLRQAPGKVLEEVLQDRLDRKTSQLVGGSLHNSDNLAESGANYRSALAAIEELRKLKKDLRKLMLEKVGYTGAQEEEEEP